MSTETKRFQIDPALVAEAAGIGMGIVVEVGEHSFVASLPERIGSGPPLVPPHLVPPLNMLIGAAEKVIWLGRAQGQRPLDATMDPMSFGLGELERAVREFRRMVTISGTQEGQG